MRVFTIHMPPEAASPAEPLVIAEEFCWPAGLFGPLWLAAHRLWREAGAALLALLAAGLIGWWLWLAVAALLGFAAQDLRRRALARAGWVEQGVVAAPDRDAAIQRLVDAAA
jgi:hypothetical protein